MSKPKKVCDHCGGLFEVERHRFEAARFCSRKCSAVASAKRAEPNTTCTECGNQFHMKPSAKARYKRSLGYFCSYACSAKHKARAYRAEGNPNWRGRNCDQYGYRLYVPQAGQSIGKEPLRGMKLHQAVCCELLGIRKIPNRLHVHHRDCNILNNDPSNLALMTASDHKWLHQQYGVAVLSAFMRGDVDIDDLVEWSDDQSRAWRLLTQHIEMQATIGKLIAPLNPAKTAAMFQPVRVDFIEVE